MTLADLIDKHWPAAYALALFAVVWTPVILAAGLTAAAKHRRAP